jgi:hypothetical protein
VNGSPAGPPVHRLLRLAAHLELLTLVLLLANLATGHDERVSSAVGPVHGGLYLTVIIALLLREGTPGRVRALGLVPGAGGLLAVRAADRGRRAAVP